MSVTTSVFIARAALPTTAIWQQAIDALDVGLVLAADTEPTTQEGYWPATLQGSSSGFEFYLEDRADEGDEAPAEVGDRDVEVLFVTHSDLIELKCALLAAVALARRSDGVIVDEDLEVWPTDDVEAEARSIS
jgi:hypothetical protein